MRPFPCCRIPRLLSCLLLAAWVFASGGCTSRPKPPSEAEHVRFVYTVTPGVLIRGAEADEEGLRELRDRFGVKTIINFNNLSDKSEAKRAKEFGLNYLPLPDNPLFDKGDDKLHLAFMKAVRDAQRTGQVPVYVHCDTGLDRVGLAVGVYRIVEDGWTAERASAELRGYQRYLLTVFFHQYPKTLEEVERTRDTWRTRLDEAPSPAVQINNPNTQPG